MSSFLLRRLAHAALTLVGITIVVFAMIHAAPGDPVQMKIGGPAARNATPEVIESLRRDLGLNVPLPLQYLGWLGDALHGDLGKSYVNGRPVAAVILDKVPATVELNVAGLLLAAMIGIPVGLFAGAHSGGRVDRVSGTVAFILFALPNFWVALILMNLLAVETGLLPLYGMSSSGSYRWPLAARVFDHLHHLILPAAVLAYAQIAIFLRFTRTAMLDVIGREYIAAARARGVPELRILTRHALRNAMIPLITLGGLVIPTLISGAIVVEQIFEWDGLGRLFFTSILSRDYPTIMGLTLLTGAFVVAASLLTDLLYGWFDPRITWEGRR